MILYRNGCELNYADVQGVYVEAIKDTSIHYIWLKYHNSDLTDFEFNVRFHENQGSSRETNAYWLDFRVDS